MKPLRIMLVTTSLEMGGAEAQVLLLAAGFRRAGHEVAVVSMCDPEPGHPDADTVLGLGMPQGVPDPRGALRLARLVRRWRPDVVHSHMVHANLLARITRLLAPMPVLISTAHSLNEGARWREVAYRLTDRLASLTTNVAQVAVDRYVQVGAVPRARVRAVPNGLDLTPFDASPAERAAARDRLGVDGRFQWLAVGRLVPEKDYATLLAAVAALREDDLRTFQVAIIGDGPERAALDRTRDALGVADRVRFLGARHDVAAWMAASDAFLLSSVMEGLPMVLLEAAASRLPTVTTDVGGASEIVLHERTGLLVPPATPDRLADAMRTVMRLPDADRLAWGDAARDHVAGAFDLPVIIDRWLGTYRELLAGTERNAA